MRALLELSIHPASCYILVDCAFYQWECVVSRQVSEGDFSCHFESSESSDILLNNEVPSWISSGLQLPLRRGVGLVCVAVRFGASWGDTLLFCKGLVRNWHLLPSWVFEVLSVTYQMSCVKQCAALELLCVRAHKHSLLRDENSILHLYKELM